MTAISTFDPPIAFAIASRKFVPASTFATSMNTLSYRVRHSGALAIPRRGLKHLAGDS
jgi:hypothetical protein